MNKALEGKKIAILVAHGFEQVELLEPRKALEEAGAQTEVVSPEQGEVKGWNHTEWGQKVKVDRLLSEANPDDYAALLLPGGVMNPDHLRMNHDAVKFAHRFFQDGKPVAAICHGPWLLVETGDITSRTVTSWPSLRTDIQNAGGTWVDQEVMVDNGLVTSRKPADIPAFNRRMIEEFVEGHHEPKDPSAGLQVPVGAEES